MNRKITSEYIFVLLPFASLIRFFLWFFIDIFSTSPYPTAIQTSLEALCTIARFDSSGRFIATGRTDGLAVIWDMDIKGPVRYLDGHVKNITSVECVDLCIHIVS